MIKIEIKKELLKLRDEKYSEFNSKLCPDTKKQIIGIRIPKIRVLAKEILKQENWKEILNSIGEEYFEETILKGLIISYSKITFEEKIEKIKEFIPQMDSWAATDSFVPALKIKKNNLKEYWKFILPYTKSDKEFEVRFAIISMLDYFLVEEYLEDVLDILNNINHDGYYVKMAIAWTLAEIGIKFNDRLLKFMKEENNLDNFTYNKTLQKMIESYRIEDSQKDLLRKMKRK